MRGARRARNLLDNASKYSPSGARIDMSVVAKDGALDMTVSDNGIGITAAVLPHVFERFVQDPHAVAFNGAGLGIGLSVVREWVQARGGNGRRRTLSYNLSVRRTTPPWRFRP